MFNKEKKNKENKNKKLNWFFIISFSLLLIGGAFYIRYSERQIETTLREQALLIGRTSASGINGEMVKQLKAVPEDAGTVYYESIKRRLEQFLLADQDLRFVYLYTLKNDEIYFLADSEPSSSEDYSPPGQEYTEAGDEEKMSFINGQEILVGPSTDRWGTWMSVLVPLKNHESGEVFAVLGMDYPFEKWQSILFKNNIKSIIEVIVTLISYAIIFGSFKKVLVNEQKFKSLIKNIPGVIFRCKVDKNWTMVFLNERIIELSGYPYTDFINNKVRSFASIICSCDSEYVNQEIQKAVDNKISYDIEYRIKTVDKRIVWVKERGEAVYGDSGNPLYLDGFILDITAEKEITEEIKEKKEELEKINKFMTGRELKMIELKAKIKELEEKLK